MVARRERNVPWYVMVRLYGMRTKRHRPGISVSRTIVTKILRHLRVECCLLCVDGLGGRPGTVLTGSGKFLLYSSTSCCDKVEVSRNFSRMSSARCSCSASIVAVIHGRLNTSSHEKTYRKNDDSVLHRWLFGFLLHCRMSWPARLQLKRLK